MNIKRIQIKGEDPERWTVFLRHGKPAGLILSDFKEFTDGLPPAEKKRLAEKYTTEQFRVFLEGANWEFNNLKPIIDQLRHENSNLRGLQDLDKEREKLKRLIKEHRRGGKPNWSEIARRLGHDRKTVQKRVNALGVKWE